MLTGRPATTVTALLLMAAGCGGPQRSAGSGADPASSSARSAPAPIASTSATGSQPARSAPAQAFAVGVRRLDLIRGTDRPLPTVLWYPAPGTPGDGSVSQAPVAPGPFPLLLFSHGLTGKPENYASLLTRIAAAGFVVAAPAYPHTSGGVERFDATDVVNQPADAYFVISQVLRLNDQAGGWLAGRLDRNELAAAGHSAGGFTTFGMLTAPQGTRLAAAIIISGGGVGTASKPPGDTLFIHGDADRTVSYPTGRTAYDELRSRKAFLTVLGGDHTRFLGPGHPAFDVVRATMTDFLRAALYHDDDARSRLPTDGTSAVTRYESASAP